MFILISVISPLAADAWEIFYVFLMVVLTGRRDRMWCNAMRLEDEKYFTLAIL